MFNYFNEGAMNQVILRDVAFNQAGEGSFYTVRSKLFMAKGSLGRNHKPVPGYIHDLESCISMTFPKEDMGMDYFDGRRENLVQIFGKKFGK